MRWRALSRQQRLRIGTLAILAVGFAAAIVIYLTAQPPPENPLGYDPLDTKKYLHDLEVYGGKANVIAAEFRDWFDSLWHGKQLAFTVAVITLIAVGVFRFFAKRLPLAAPAEAEGVNSLDGEATSRNVVPFGPRGPAPRE
jgi:hypothetical protein